MLLIIMIWNIFEDVCRLLGYNKLLQMFKGGII